MKRATAAKVPPAKAVPQKTPKPAPAPRRTKKDLEPDNKSATPATETKEASSRKGKAPRRYQVVLTAPHGRVLTDAAKAAGARGSVTLPPASEDDAQDNLALAIARADAALSTSLEGTKATVVSYALEAGVGARGRVEYQKTRGAYVPTGGR